MPEIHRIDIQAPLEQVFECLADPRRAATWAAGVEDVSMQTPYDPAAPLGARFSQRVREGGRSMTYEGTIMAFERPHHYAVQVGSAQYAMETDYRLTPLGGATCVAIAVRTIRGPRWMVLLAPLSRWLTRRIVRQQAAALRDVAERGGCAETA